MSKFNQKSLSIILTAVVILAWLTANYYLVIFLIEHSVGQDKLLGIFLAIIAVNVFFVIIVMVVTSAIEYTYNYIFNMLNNKN